MAKVMTPAEFKKFMKEFHESLRVQAESVAAFADNSPKARKDRIAKARKSTQAFFEIYLSDIFDISPAKFHYQIDKLANTPDTMVGISAPRGGAKTTRGIDINGLRDFLLGLEKYAGIFADTEDVATPKLVFIKTQCESNARIKADFGEVIGRIWNSEFIVNKKNNCAIGIYAFRKPFRGLKWGIHRLTKAWIDDLENDQSAMSPDACRNRLAFVEDTIIPALAAKNSKLLWLGTILSPICAFQQFLEKRDEEEGELVYQKLIIDCYQDKQETISFWPEMMSVEWLKKRRRQLGKYTFNKEYRNKCLPEDADFEPEWFEHHYCLAEMSQEWLDSLMIYRLIDPASGSKSKSGSFPTSITVGLDLKKYHFYILQCSIEKIKPLEMIKRVATQHKAIPAVTTWIEENTYKDLLAPLIRDSNDGKYFNNKVPTETFITSDNKDLRILTMQAPLESGWYYFDLDVDDTKELIEQYTYYPKGYKDGPDTLAMLHKRITDLVARSGFQSESSGARESAKVTKGW